MNNLIKLITFFVLIFLTNCCISQVIELQNNAGNRWGRLNPDPSFNATSLGIGVFGTPTQPLAALHVNTTGLTNPFYGAGNLFRTDGPAGSLNQWQLFTGGTEKFRVSVANSSSNVNINVFQTAHMLFSTSNTERMRLTSIGRLGLGIGAPVSLRHLTATTSGNIFRTDVAQRVI